MSDLNPKEIEIELDGVKYGLLFTVNLIDDLQSHFGVPISDVFDMMNDEMQMFKVITKFLEVAINEHIDEYTPDVPHVNARMIGRKMNLQKMSMNDAKEKIFGAFSTGMPNVEEDSDPNVTSEQ